MQCVHALYVLVLEGKNVLIKIAGLLHLNVLRNLLILLHLTLQIVLGLFVEAADAIDANFSNQLILAEIHRELLHFFVGEWVVTNVNVNEMLGDMMCKYQA